MNEPRKIGVVLLVLLAFGLLSVAYEWLRDSGRTWLALVIAILALLVLVLGIHFAQARDLDGRYAASPLKQWFDSLRSGKGPCCSDADGSAVSDVDWESRDGRYRVRIDDTWYDVPDDAVITEPNRVGRTMVWPLLGRDGVSIRCFMQGPMT
jgi:hypothetical protein